MLLDGYIRVSQVGRRGGERFISPTVQRQEIEHWTSSHHATLGAVFEELNESGGRGDRPLLMRALERIEQGDSEGLVVAKLDRFGRSLIDGLKSIMRIEAAGGIFVSVQDGIDLSTPTGKLVLRILLSVGEWELERARNGWSIAQERAIARGVYIGHKAPCGYQRGEDGRLRVDPLEGPIMREAFERRAGGESCAKIAQFLERAGIRGARGRPFSEGAVWGMLRNTAYKGEAHCGVHRNPLAHEALVDPATWQKAQSAPRQPRPRVPGLVGGMIKCGGCGRTMTAMWVASGGSRTLTQHHIYRCYSPAGVCEQPATARSEELDPLIEDLIFSGRMHRTRASSERRRVEECEAAVARAEEDVASYRDNPRLLRILGSESFEAGIASRQQRLEQKLLHLARARRAMEPPPIDLEVLEREWPQLSWDARRGAVRELIDCVVVERGMAPLIERAWVFKRGRGPLAGERRRAGSARGALRLPKQRRWPGERIERELRGFFAERAAVWPHYLSFAEAGKARLHAQTMAWGGPYYWGAKLGFEVPRRGVKWSESRVEAALGPFLAGREEWPERREFERAGMLSLYWAINNHGGKAHWAEHFGVRYRSHAWKWSKPRVERELREFLGERRMLPLRAEFEAAGKVDLWVAMRQCGGMMYWSRKLGVAVQAGPIDRRGRH